MSVIGTEPVLAKASGVSSPGTLVTISEPGLKPSARFQSVGSMGLPATLRGMSSRLKSTRRPVGGLGSALVKLSFGNGSRQAEGSRSSQAACAAAGAASEMSRTMRTRAFRRIQLRNAAVHENLRLIGAATGERRGQRRQEDLDVARHRPAGDVLVVEAHHLAERDVRAARDLPEAGDPRAQVE